MKLSTISRPWRFRKIVQTLSSDVLPGNTQEQNFSVVGITQHIGVILECKNCRNYFTFSAKEQQHWYEELKFWADSVPIECDDCRGKTRAVVILNKRLSKVLAKEPKSLIDYNEITDIAAGLNHNGVKLGGRLAQRIRMAAKRSTHKYKEYVLQRSSSD
jgi:hypothetical protein